MKSFLIRLYKNIFEIISDKINYTIQEQVVISLQNLYNFTQEVFKNLENK